MYLTKSQHKILKLLKKSDGSDNYFILHENKYFKTDFQFKSSVEHLKENGYIKFGVFTEDPQLFKAKTHIDKSAGSETDYSPLIKHWFEEVDYLEPTNRLFITEKGLSYLQDRFYRKLLFWIPYAITTLIALGDIVVKFIFH